MTRITLLNFLIILFFVFARFVNADEILYGKDIKDQASIFFKAKNIRAELIVSDRRAFFFCSNTLKFRPKYENDWQTIDVLCEPQNWASTFRTTALGPSFAQAKKANTSTTSPVIKLTRNMSVGQIIEEGDIELIEMPQKKVFGGFQSENELIGRKISTNLVNGTILKPRHVEHMMTVNKNDTVLIVLGNKNISIVTYGIALASGQKGDMIGVKNVKSEKILKAIILSEKKVKPLTNM